MGPIIILDKSAFQSLSAREHIFLDIHFMENLTPILGLEILGDLRKEGQGSRTAEEIVTVLAGKFGGSGPATNVDYRTLCVNSLLGNHFPLDGRIVPQSARVVRSPDGSRGIFIDLSPFNQAILRWSNGQFTEFERELAGHWRQVTRNLDYDSFVEQLNVHHVILPHVANVSELRHHIDALLDIAALQNVWLTWLLGQLSVPADYERAIMARWKASGHYLQEFAPYAWHCVRVLLMLIGATRHQLISWNPTNLLDIQYLYYLPFCMVFASEDRVHQALVPILLRENQSFVTGSDLKADLHRIVDFRDALSEKQNHYLGYGLGSYPPPARDSVIHELWKMHCRPWRPGRGNQASNLPDEEKRKAIAWAREMFQEIEGDGYFSDSPTTD